MDPDTYDQTYIDAAIKRGTQGTDTFGQRIMWDSMPGLLTRLRALQGDGADTTVLDRAFGANSYIHLQRADKIAQAVSLAIAEQTGLWHRNADGTDLENFNLADVAIYDDAQITKELNGLNQETTGWTNWFAANNICPHRITYEDLAANPRGELSRILTFLGHDPAIATILTPGTQKLGNQMNHDWAARYRADHDLPPAPAPV